MKHADSTSQTNENLTVTATSDHAITLASTGTQRNGEASSATQQLQTLHFPNTSGAEDRKVGKSWVSLLTLLRKSDVNRTGLGLRAYQGHCCLTSVALGDGHRAKAREQPGLSAEERHPASSLGAASVSPRRQSLCLHTAHAPLPAGAITHCVGHPQTAAAKNCEGGRAAEKDPRGGCRVAISGDSKADGTQSWVNCGAAIL